MTPATQIRPAADLFADAELAVTTVPRVAPAAIAGQGCSWLPPTGARERVEHNLAVVRLVARLQAERCQPTPAQRVLLSCWGGWGAVPEVFDETVTRFAPEREQLRGLLGASGFAAASRSTINAHYTHPLIVDAIWRLARRAGFGGVRVLEPGCGPGVFIARAPTGLQVVGVELEPVSAAIAQLLCPEATICPGSFADQRSLKDARFDLAIGNVPFGDITLYDPVHNRGRHSIHNHFLLKALHLLAPGGLLIALTSRYTLDARNDHARREMHELAQLIGALRLPAGAHRQVAGTEAVTDLVIFRRRQRPAALAAPAWLDSVAVEIDGEQVHVNRHFLTPGRVAGELAVDNGPYARTLTVTGDTSAHAVAAAIDTLADTLDLPALRAAAATPAPITPAAPLSPSAVLELGPVDPELDFGAGWDGHIVALPGSAFATLSDGAPVPLAVPRSAARELRLLLDLRDQASKLLSGEASRTDDAPELEQLRARLAATYGRYRAAYGPINRYNAHQTGKVDPESGEPTVRRTYPRAVRVLLGDPVGPLVLSLEIFDDDTQTAVAADLLSERVLRRRQPVTSVATAQEALAVSYDQLGRVDLDAIARLLDLDHTDGEDVGVRVLAALGELVYRDPESDTLVLGSEYLSGNVRVKLDRAREAAARDPAFEVNVSALLRVLPADLGAGEIEAKLGAVWISDTVHTQFISELLDSPHARVEYGGGNLWAVDAPKWGTLARSTWGTARMPAPDLMQALCEQKPIVVKDSVPDTGRYVINADETTAAQEKAAALQERFAEWCWEDPARACELAREYNRRFNSLVLRDYEPLGQTLTLPGLAESFTPSVHQRTAVARIVSEPSVGLFHAVGAGKTAAMVIAAHELRRLGLISKPVVVVPNHMLEQFAREWLQLYPLAKLLAAGSDDLARDRRRAFAARAAANSWDAIVMTRTAFERLSVSPKLEQEYMTRELDGLRAQLADGKARGARLTVKRLEKMLARAEAGLQKRLDGAVDIGVCFEQTGIDYVFCDEAHAYKNLATVSNIEGAAVAGSKRASDLHMKLEHLRHAGGGRVATFATATPIANSITEAHVMSRYLRPDLLAEAGIGHFDAWAATFGQTVTAMEMAVTGAGSYRVKTRFARFQNVPEMLLLWHVFADVKTPSDLDLPVPPLKPREDGQRLPEPVVIGTPPEVSDYLHLLADRAERVKNRQVDPTEDNMLKISTDGRKAALDMRLVGPGTAVEGVCKLQVVAENIARIHRLTRNVAYRIPGTDQRHPVLGSLQLVFCDLSTPTSERWHAYGELRRLLTARGVDAGLVRFIHEARSDVEKARLFEACRSGQVAVLIGSTEKMGVGTNIQARAIALHHVDCPWRPADIEQRDGRILRQGNQNSGVRIYRYVVQGSFDAYSWQTVERKARFIGQVMQGRLDARTVDDISDSTLSFAEVKALAAGDTLILEQANLAAEVTRLTRLARAHNNNQAALQMTVSSLTERLAKLDRDLEAIDRAIADHVDTRGENFALALGEAVYRNRTQAAIALVHLLDGMAANHPAPVGRLGAIGICANIRYGLASGEREAFLTLEGLAFTDAHAQLSDARRDPLTLIRQLEARANDLDGLRARTLAAKASAKTEAHRASESIGAQFKHAQALQDARARLTAVEAELAEKAQRQEHRAAAAAPTVSPADQPVAVAAAAGDDIPF